MKKCMSFIAIFLLSFSLQTAASEPNDISAALYRIKDTNVTLLLKGGHKISGIAKHVRNGLFRIDLTSVEKARHAGAYNSAYVEEKNIVAVLHNVDD